MKKLLVIVLAVMMMLSLFVGCTNEPAGAEDASAKNVEAKVDADEQVASAPTGIVEGSSATMSSNMDIVAQQFPGQVPPASWMYGYLYDTLFYYPNGDNDIIEGLLAKDWTVSEDKLIWVINLHEDVYFNNGNKLNAESVIGSFKFLEQHQKPVFAQMESFEATGEYQITFKLTSPMPELERQFAVKHLGVFDHTQVLEYIPGQTPDGADTAIGFPSVDLAYQIGSGPYYVSEFAPGDFMTFTANSNYFHEGRTPKIETINCKIIMDPTTTLAAIQTGELDYAQLADYSQYEILKDSEEITIVQGLGANRCLFFNADTSRNNLLGNKNVRKALSMMVDMEQVAIAATDGYGYVIKNAFNESFAYDDGRVYDPEGAIALLEEEGVNPEDIKLSALVDNGTKPIYENLQAQLMQYGVTLEFSVQDIPAVMTFGKKGEWDIWSEHGGMTLWDFISPIRMLLSEDATFNVFNDAEVEEQQIWPLVLEASSALSYEEEKEKINDIAKVLGDEYAYIGNVQLPGWAVFSNRIGNPVAGKAQLYWEPWCSYVIE